jgi:hypothetical protein
VAISHVKAGAAGGVVVGRVVGEDVGIGVTNDDVGSSTVGCEFD